MNPSRLPISFAVWVIAVLLVLRPVRDLARFGTILLLDELCVHVKRHCDLTLTSLHWACCQIGAPASQWRVLTLAQADILATSPQAGFAQRTAGIGSAGPANDAISWRLLANAAANRTESDMDDKVVCTTGEWASSRERDLGSALKAKEKTWQALRGGVSALDST